MSRFTSLFSIIFLALTVACSTGPKNTSDAPEGWQTFEFPYFEISAPQTWTLDTSGRMGTKLVIFAPYDSTEALFRENLNLVTEDISTKNVDLKGYVDNAQRLLEEYMEGFAEFDMSQDGDRYWLNYRGEQQTVVLYFNQMITLRRDHIHILTFTSNEAESENAKNAVEIMKTFEFTGE